MPTCSAVQRSKMHTAGFTATMRRSEFWGIDGWNEGRDDSGWGGEAVELAIQLGDGLFEHAPMGGHRCTLEVVPGAYSGQFQLTAPQLDRVLLGGQVASGKLLLVSNGFFLLRLDRLRLETSCHISIVWPSAPFAAAKCATPIMVHTCLCRVGISVSQRLWLQAFCACSSREPDLRSAALARMGRQRRNARRSRRPSPLCRAPTISGRRS